jgi:beta-lactamase class A
VSLPALPSRRYFLARRYLLALALASVAPLSATPAGPASASVKAALARLEKKSGGRLGVCILNTETRLRIGHRMQERFSLCSTFKLLLAGLILREIDTGRLKAETPIRFADANLKMAWPDTVARLDDGVMTILALARTSQTSSDNAAANILLDLIGGPAGFTRAVRQMGDTVTRLDRYETDLNLVLPGDVRDTTTPAAMAETVARILMGNVLTPASRTTLINWMVETKTGLKRLRAGLPPTWRAGDKTGTGIADAAWGMVNKYNDVAIVFPPRAAPVIIATYFDADAHYDDMRDLDQAVLATVGKIATKWIHPE